MPRGIEFVEAAAVDRRREPEAVVDGADDAAQVPAPADAREANAGRVDFRTGAQERVAAHDRRDRMVCPLVTDRLADLRNGTAPAGRSRPFVTRMRLAVSLTLRNPAARVHRNRRIAPVVPRLHPLGECRATAAVHEHHGRDLAIRARTFGQTPPREHARRLALPRLAFNEDRLDTLDPPVVVRAGNRDGERARRCVQRLDIPQAATAAREVARGNSSLRSRERHRQHPAYAQDKNLQLSVERFSSFHVFFFFL